MGMASSFIQRDKGYGHNSVLIFRIFVCVGVESTQLGHVECGQFT